MSPQKNGGIYLSEFVPLEKPEVQVQLLALAADLPKQTSSSGIAIGHDAYEVYAAIRNGNGHPQNGSV